METQIEQLIKKFHAKTASEVTNSSVGQFKEVHANNETPLNNTINEPHKVSFVYDKGIQVAQEEGASVNLIPKSMFEHLKLARLKKIDILVEMADMTKSAPIGIIENVLVKIDKFLFSSYFVIIDMLNIRNETMILGRPFLATIHAEIDVFNKEISLGIGMTWYREAHDNDLIWDNRYAKWCSEISSPDTPTSILLQSKKIANLDQGTISSRNGIGKKGHMLDDIWENCKKVQGDNTYLWHDHGLEENERQESSLDIEEYDPPQKNTSIGTRDTGFGRGKQAKEEIQGQLRRNLPAGVTP
ncbi:putative reverse transcriptase domain-containing protein [Tanacetum coccineum]